MIQIACSIDMTAFCINKLSENLWFKNNHIHSLGILRVGNLGWPQLDSAASLHEVTCVVVVMEIAWGWIVRKALLFILFACSRKMDLGPLNILFLCQLEESSILSVEGAGEIIEVRKVFWPFFFFFLSF